MCLYPKTIKNKRYLPNKKNNWNPPKCKDIRKMFIEAPCGVCMKCKKKKARDWSIRLKEDIKVNKQCYFVRLSYSPKWMKHWYQLNELMDIHDEGYNLDNWVAKKSIRMFLERWRKKYKKSVRHWGCTELGPNYTERLHIHMILWCSKEQIQNLDRLWKYGQTWIGKYVNSETAGYIAKYMSKSDPKHKGYQSVMFTSAGIGMPYVTKQIAYKAMGYEIKDYYKHENGYVTGLPQYYKNKLFTEEERDHNWTKKLDAHVLYLGQKVYDLKLEGRGLQWFNARNSMRELNRELGYLSPKSIKRYKKKELYWRKLKQIQATIEGEGFMKIMKLKETKINWNKRRLKKAKVSPTDNDFERTKILQKPPLKVRGRFENLSP